MKPETKKLLTELKDDLHNEPENWDALTTLSVVLGCLFGAGFGWSLLPEETLNLFQFTLAAAGFFIGGYLGLILGKIILPIALVVVVLYFFVFWLLSN